MLLRHGRGFGLSDLEETAKVAGHRPLGSRWFRPEKVQATSSFACQLQSTYKDLSRVDLDLPEGLLVGLGYAATSPDSPFDFRQAQTAAERSGVAGPHCWSLMEPMARLAISNKQINRLVRTFLWRRVTEKALHGSSFVDIPDEINQAYIEDLLRISEAFAPPLSNLFAFVKSGHPACPFITHKQLALYANPRFWQYGLLAFIARCCSFDNQHRHQGPGTAQVEE